MVGLVGLLGLGLGVCGLLVVLRGIGAADIGVLVVMVVSWGEVRRGLVGSIHMGVEGVRLWGGASHIYTIWTFLVGLVLPEVL